MIHAKEHISAFVHSRGIGRQASVLPPPTSACAPPLPQTQFLREGKWCRGLQSDTPFRGILAPGPSLQRSVRGQEVFRLPPPGTR